MIIEPIDFINGTFLVPQAPAVRLSPKPSLLSFISDGHLTLALPVIAYWAYGLFFHYLDTHDMFVRYRLHTPEELTKRNKCSLRAVIQSVMMQHVIQTFFGVVLEFFQPGEMIGSESYDIWRIQHFFALASGIAPASSKSSHVGSLAAFGPVLQLLGLSTFRLSETAASAVYYLGIPFFKVFVAFIIIDSWQYLLHRYMHTNLFLYRHLHSVHHRLYVPYAFGALYNSLLEGFLLDTLGAGIAHLTMNLTSRESMILYTFSTLKTVDDHCGYELPFDPFQRLFPNNAAYHDIHHQHFGIKTNFSQPFFTFWDQLCGTKYHRIQEYEQEQRVLREKNYQEHLKELEQKKKQ